MQCRIKSYLCHDFVLTFLHILPISFHNGLQEPEVLNTPPMCFNAVDKVMDHTVTDLIAQIVVVHKNVMHCLSFQQLVTKQGSIILMQTEKQSKLISFRYSGPSAGATVCSTKREDTSNGKVRKVLLTYPWSEEEVQMFM